MLREQRLALINGDIIQESTIEQLYYESISLLNNNDTMGGGIIQKVLGMLFRQQ